MGIAYGVSFIRKIYIGLRLKSAMDKQSLGYIFILGRLHHSSDMEYLDKNHAGTLIIWDRLFGMYEEEIFKPIYGLTEDINC